MSRQLTLKGLINEIKESTTGTHSRKFCFVLGAGASKSSGIPTGGELIDNWDKELEERDPEGYAKWKSENQITDENKYSHYGEYYAKRFERDKARRCYDGYNYLEKKMERARPAIGYVMLSLVMQKTPHKMVLTTNFDHLLEDAFSHFGSSFPLVIGHESLAPYVTIQTTRPTVVKIHRDLLLNPINSAEELSKLNEEWEAALDLIFSQYHPVFIGYAGNDKSVMNFLMKNVDNFRSGKWAFPYWLTHGERSPEGMAAEFLDQADAYEVHCADFDDFMVRLADALQISVPSREDFIQKAKEQYNALVHAAAHASAEKSPLTEFLPDSEQREAEPSAETEEKPAEEKSKTADDYHMEALLQMRMDNYKKALNYELQALKIKENSLDPDDPELATSYNNVGAIYSNLDDFEKSLNYLLKNLRILEKSLPNDHPRLATAYIYVGCTYIILSEYEKSLDYLLKALKIREKVLTPDHLDLAFTYNIVGIAYKHLGDYQKALTYQMKALDVWEKVLSPNHPVLAQSYDNIGVTYEALGDREKAEEYHRKAEEIRNPSKD